MSTTFTLRGLNVVLYNYMVTLLDVEDFGGDKKRIKLEV
jgi:hypothetical protein